MNHLSEYQKWLTSKYVDEETKEYLRTIKEDEEAIKFRFVSYLSFGTAGLRGIMTAGTNAMNLYTVAHATQGLASLINERKMAERGVVIAYDSRIHSTLFAQTAAEVLAGNGIKVYFFESLRPTPVLSFSIRELHCIAGINITASHNPKEYNGYKVYWEDGAQLSPEDAAMVSSYIEKTDIFEGVKRTDFNQAIQSKQILLVGQDLDEKYYKQVLSQQIRPELISQEADRLKIVYTPLHGAGYKMVPEVLKRAGIQHLVPVECQMLPDGNFPTLKNPNPEFPEAYVPGIQTANEIGSDLIIATDPDADRTGIMVRGKDGQFTAFTGNQIGALLLHYIIQAYKETNSMPNDPYAVKTIVSTELATKICEKNGIKLYNVLTGFKYIGEVIKKHEEIGKGSFLLGFEESNGYLKGTYARDKDAVVASLLLCEMAAYYSSKNMTLIDALESLYCEMGYYTDKTISFTMQGLDGIAKIQKIMENLREHTPEFIGQDKVCALGDYQKGTILNRNTQEEIPTNLPSSNVLSFKTDTENVIIARPSGTEPKLKIYLLVHGKTKEESEQKTAEYESIVRTWTEI